MSRGRQVPETKDFCRSDFQRDRDRILHSSAFRRLKRKTQVFAAHQGDHYRTRLTHTLEVAQIARTIARALALNEDLTEAIALAHDIGHPPFGHVGESALNHCMQNYGEFDHNAQALRIVTLLEQRYARFDGLNLCWETLEGIGKHGGPILPEKAPLLLSKTTIDLDIDLGKFASAEAQTAALADDIAYNMHDLDDGMRAGLFSVEELISLPLIGEAITENRERYKNSEVTRQWFEAQRQIFGILIGDVIKTSRDNIAKYAPASVDDVRMLPGPLVMFSPTRLQELSSLKQFLFEHMYQHQTVTSTMEKAERALGRMFEYLIDSLEHLPQAWRSKAKKANNSLDEARLVADYLAGMTDGFALLQYKKYFGEELE